MIAQWSRDLGMWLYVAALICLVSMLAFVYLAQASYVAGQMEQMVGLEYQVRTIKEDSNALLVCIARYEDLSRIKTEARALGLGEPKHVEYVEVVVDEPLSPTGWGGGDSPHGSSAGEGIGLQPPSPGLWSKAVQQFRQWIVGGTVRAEQPVR
jgi:hypothetical protein